MADYFPETTIRYKTYLKRSLVSAMKTVFRNHPDELLQRTKVTIESPTSEIDFPAIVVRFFERDFYNAGVGHIEKVIVDGHGYHFKHYLYSGDIEFAVYCLSSLDRDLVSDSIIQTLTMGELEAYTDPFAKRIYPSSEEVRDSDLHFMNLNTDRIQGFGESQVPVPWAAEDDIVYMTSYRIGVFGECYSLPPGLSYELVERVIRYPYLQDAEAVPQGDPNTDDGWI